jgi:hypothetical protein
MGTTRIKPSSGNAIPRMQRHLQPFTEARGQLRERHQALNKEINPRMHRLNSALPLLLRGALVAQVAPEPGANSRPYTMLYVFGDSYSDSGQATWTATALPLLCISPSTWALRSLMTAIRAAPARG